SVPFSMPESVPFSMPIDKRWRYMCTRKVVSIPVEGNPCPYCGLYDLEFTARGHPAPGWRNTYFTHVRLRCRICRGEVPFERVPAYFSD
ncbi:MAG: hypothetical protein OXK74_02070, partial [Gemmatimonadota bacterium]|nr:hypothetical protein [Gemmatimonadota bacterium]